MKRELINQLTNIDSKIDSAYLKPSNTDRWESSIAHHGQPTTPRKTLDKLLAERRISQDTIDLFEIQATGNGWAYPVMNGAGTRIKHKKGKPNKYSWYPSKPHGRPFYCTPGLLDLVQKYSVVWIVESEADVWALHSAGVRHCACMIGNANDDIKALGPILSDMGALTVFVAPEVDNRGARWAEKVQKAIQGTGIELVAKTLPLGAKGDIGELWRTYTKEIAFERYLLSLPDYEIKQKTQAVKLETPKYGEAHPVPMGYRELVAEALNVEWRSNGKSKPIRCPFHDDKNPSAVLHIEKGLYCSACDLNFLFKDIGAHLKLPTIAEWAQSVELPQLSTEAREALIKAGETGTARFVDALYLVASWRPETIFTIRQAIEALSEINVKIDAAYRALKSPKLADKFNYSQNFDTNTRIQKRRGQKTANNSPSRTKRGPKANKYRLPALSEIARALGVADRLQHTDYMPTDKLTSAKSYRAEVHAAMIRRLPGQYSRMWLSSRLGVSAQTTRNYDKITGIKVTERVRREKIGAVEMAKLPNDRKNISHAIWLEVRKNGKTRKFAPTQDGAKRATGWANGAEIWKCTQEKSYYSG